VCKRKALQLKAPHAAPLIKNFPHDVLPTNLQLFKLLFPMDFIKNVMIPNMNEQLGGTLVTYREFL